MRSRSLLYAYSHKHTSTPRISYKFCECTRGRFANDSAELELTVSLLVQIDKLVMLIESPVFTSESSSRIRLTVTDLRLQLLEPDKYPHLPKCLYGLLMILPQSSAFVSLRARLSVVYSSGYVPQSKP